MTKPLHPVRRLPYKLARGQRGVVMFIALIVMVALSLAAIALVRSVDTTNAVVGNLSFRLASILPGNFAVEKAAAALFPNADIASAVRISDVQKYNDFPAENYFATRQPDDARGIPNTLLKKTAFDGAGLTKYTDPATSTEIRYVIERMCSVAGAPAIGNCDLLPSKLPSGMTGGKGAIPLPREPYYRVTIRVDGPQNTASFLQAMLK
jgi:type IV pilus assembly protein PilX